MVPKEASMDGMKMSDSSVSIGLSDAAAREIVHRRACELARIAGHSPADISQREYEQAKREAAAGRPFDGDWL